MTQWRLPPAEIEQRSMAIIDAEAGNHGWPPDEWSVVRRMIHTTADFDFITSVRFSPGAVEAGKRALRAGATIFTDTQMAKAGVSQARIKPWGCEVVCLMNDAVVARDAQSRGVTRAMAAVDAVSDRLEGAIYLVGNAPTALLALLDHAGAGHPSPALVVGLPVGFVNAAESKDALTRSSLTFITSLGRKGGSALAAAVINALADLAQKEA